VTPFELRRAATVGQAVAWLREDPDAKLLAGGQSLLAAKKLGLAAPAMLIDLGRIGDLRAIRLERDALWVGAMCTHGAVAASPIVREHAPGLAYLAAGIADPQVRNMGTLGGSVANADPAACWPAGVLAAGATLVSDRREITADDFFLGLFTTALEPDEVLTGVRFPLRTSIGYLKEEQPASRFALAGVAVARDRDGVRVAVTGLGHGVFRWGEAEAALAKRFSPAALQGLAPDLDLAAGDLHASAEYRAHLARVLACRVVTRMVSA
jgi:carbon-monoxide dehydrogenase medium subunit